jgi:hypothetical protein
MFWPILQTLGKHLNRSLYTLLVIISIACHLIKQICQHLTFFSDIPTVGLSLIQHTLLKGQAFLYRLSGIVIR